MKIIEYIKSLAKRRAAHIKNKEIEQERLREWHRTNTDGFMDLWEINKNE